jgi:hypothetical protein
VTPDYVEKCGLSFTEEGKCKDCYFYDKGGRKPCLRPSDPKILGEDVWSGKKLGKVRLTLNRSIITDEETKFLEETNDYKEGEIIFSFNIKALEVYNNE